MTFLASAGCAAKLNHFDEVLTKPVEIIVTLSLPSDRNSSLDPKANLSCYLRVKGASALAALKTIRFAEKSAQRGWQ